MLVARAVVVSWSQQPSLASVVDPMAIISACTALALDDNLGHSQILQIVELKGLISGPVQFAARFLCGRHRLQESRLLPAVSLAFSAEA